MNITNISTVIAKPKSREDIRNIALEVRKLIEYENKPFFPIVEFIEYVLTNPEFKDSAELIILEPDEMRDTYGTTNTGKNVISIRRDVYEGAVKGNPRDRFTLCHEVGHYLLPQPKCISYARGSVPKYCDPEWQANTFAGELMAPRNLIQDMSIEEIMQKCGMSYQAAAIQYNMK